MDQYESRKATTHEILSYAEAHGFDLGAVHHGLSFVKSGRGIDFWRTDNALCYSLQGPVWLLPEAFQASARAFQGMWHETGALQDLECALILLKAWLIDRLEVDEMEGIPGRAIRSHGIG